MKTKFINSILSLVFLLSPIFLKAQWLPTSPGTTGNLYRTGTVGIGTLTPNTSYKLHVVGRTDFEDIMSFKNNTTGYISWGTNDFRLVSKKDYLYLGASNATNQMVIQGSSGNVGIGTTNPVSKLDVIGPIKFQANGPNDVAAEIRTSDGASNSMTLRASALRGEIAIQNNRDFLIKDTQDKVLFYGKHGGNVGFGTTNPSAKLEIFNPLAFNTNEVASGQDHILFTSDNPGVGGFFGGMAWETGSRRRAGISGIRESADADFIGLAFFTKGTDGPGPMYESMRISHQGNVGIGTTNPIGKLDVHSGESAGLIPSVNVNGAYLTLGDRGAPQTFAQGLGIKFYDDGFSHASIIYDAVSRKFHFGESSSTGQLGIDANATTMTITTPDGASGSVGIGTSNPINAKLEIVQTANSEGLRVDGASGAFALVVEAGTTNVTHARSGLTIGANYFKPTISSPSNGLLVEGNVGIGTTDTKGFQLGVNGKIAATEVKVASYANWPDFVFEKEYEVPTLFEVENHIKDKGHLIDMPSAEEVEKNGFFLGEMDAKLLQKIEEMTLYMIQQQKQLDEQAEEIRLMKKALEQSEKEE